jgi:hypothetical protein
VRVGARRARVYEREQLSDRLLWGTGCERVKLHCIEFRAGDSLWVSCDGRSLRRLKLECCLAVNELLVAFVANEPVDTVAQGDVAAFIESSRTRHELLVSDRGTDQP